jgi:hypothetical protein
VEAWPFTEDEWQAVSDAALPVVNATWARDEVLHASCLLTLLETLAELRSRHGEHPKLLETEADFADSDEERLPLYERAIRTAETHGLQTLTIRLSLAEALLNLHRPAEARAELLACRDEMAESEDESDRKSWADLMAECERFLA